VPGPKVSRNSRAGDGTDDQRVAIGTEYGHGHGHEHEHD